MKLRAGGPNPTGWVRRWQRVLAALGHADELGASGIDDRFGPATTKATEAFQRRSGLGATGMVDEATRRLAALELAELAGKLIEGAD